MYAEDKQTAFLSSGVVTRYKSNFSVRHRRSFCSKHRNLLWRALEQGCLGCGRPSGVLKGCDGKGRIVGGLGAIWNWWPIKVYKPCPEIYKHGGTYQRAGQTLDELFGRKDTPHKQSTNVEQ